MSKIHLLMILLVSSLAACSTPDVATTPISEYSAAVVSAEGAASRIGRDILARGGSAVDAAIATGFALAVTYPEAGNIGGGGFMIVATPGGEVDTVDFREMAPRLAHPDMFLDATGKYDSAKHHRGYLSVGVPGTVAGFALAHQKYGRLPWAELVQPAIDLAREGITVTKRLEGSLGAVLDGQMKPHPSSQKVYTKNGAPLQAGDVLKQPDLGDSLARIRDHGRAGFYQGKTAALIADAMKKNAGLIDENDLAGYVAKHRPPVLAHFHDFEIVGMPLPSSGGICLAQMFNVLEGFDLKTLGHNSPEYLHLLAETMRLTFRDRARWLGDSDYVTPPVHLMLSKPLARKRQTRIPLTRAGKSAVEDLQVPHESEETTHYSVVDQDGMAVSLTYTLDYSFGSGIVVPGGGFLLNNEMGDFNPKLGYTSARGHIGTSANLAAPGKRMLSSMSPIVIRKNGEAIAVIGSPGGRTIINTVLQVALNVMVFGMSIEDAVAAPRIHHQWLPDAVLIEEGRFPAETLAKLRKMGHELKMRSKLGHAHSLGRTRNNKWRGAPDRRDQDSEVSGLP